MYYEKHQNTILIRLQRGEKLIENLNKLATQEKIGAAWLQGLGGAEWAELGFYDLETRDYKWQNFSELMEITSLQGNLSWIDNAPKWHIHGTLSDQEYHAIGGHVKELVVGGTCEITLTIIPDMLLQRHQDETTGLQLLDIKQEH